MLLWRVDQWEYLFLSVEIMEGITEEETFDLSPEGCLEVQSMTRSGSMQLDNMKGNA